MIMLKSFLNRNFFIFLLITAISIGGIIVYAMNNMQDVNDNSEIVLGNTTQASQKTNQADPQTIQNFDINNQPVQEEAPQSPSPTQTSAGSQTVPAPQTQPQTQVTQVTELQVRDILVGSGAEVKNGDSVEVNYLGTFLNGQKFDSSYDRGETFSFTVGAGQVIRGWESGLVGMKVGGKRELLIPADLAYGAAGAPGAIPPNTPLRFEIELISIN